MYTSEQISQIMQELGFNPDDANARKVIEQIANSKPHVPTIDAHFISELRKDLQARAQSVGASQNSKQTNNNLFSMFMNRTLAAALVVVVIAIGAGGVWYSKQNSTQPLFNGFGSGGELLSGKYDVKSIDAESFGDLSKVSVLTTEDAAKLNSRSATMAAGGTGGGLNAADHAQPTEKMIAPGEPYPGAVEYTFTYEGSNNLPGLQAEQPVLKRSKPVQPAGLISRIIGAMSFGLIDLNTLSNVLVQNFSFVEDKEFGYSVYVDLQNGIAGMYQNWEKWPQQQYQPIRNESELPSDEEAINAAENFIAQYKISKEGYGQPRVNKNWRGQYEIMRSQGSSDIYIPEQIQVIYPLVLNGKEVHDESGNLYGLSLSVDARTLRVTNAGDLISKQFESSSYKGETDTKRLLDVATKGGFRNYVYPVQGASKKVQLELGTPKVEMIKMYYSFDNYKTGTDLYLPALVFPIENWQQAGYWRQTVVVPLVKSILDTDVPMQPIPLDLPATTEPATGSAGSGTSGSAGQTEPAIMPSRGE